eukprot:Anaeramoba_flamelloidesa326989_73.p1 GENE.a326989_73~~a326989_73.p1  ORF type:complete len:255 (+),score=17.17 a326989_73:1490-2254(+)
MEGVTMAKALAISLNLPLIAVNHLKGHIYSCFLQKDETFPLTILLVSGGHTQVIEAKSFSEMQIIGQTIDDSFGESFDKVAKMLELGYPGGPIVEKYAKDGDSKKYDFPIPLRQSPKIEFSYSGLKNAVRMQIEKEDTLDAQTISNICASFQETAIAHIMMKLKKYFVQRSKLTPAKKTPAKNLAIVGGASANLTLRTQVEELCKKYNTKLILAPLEYCSDNAAMIGRVAIEQYKNKDFKEIDKIDINTRVKSF